MFYRTGIIADRSFTLPEYGLSISVAPATLLPDDLHYKILTRISSKYTGCANMNFLYT